MRPVFVDIHIHTSDNPNHLNTNYNSDLLLSNVRKISGDSEILLSLTDHNTINKDAYLDINSKISTIILGVELHIKKDVECDPYHCHILFNVEVTAKNIDDINIILDRLYPDKIVDDTTETVPTLEVICNEFDNYDFLLLPHGGQSHKTFNKAIKAGRRFDTTIERSIYYNQFDGFTSRSNKGIDETQKYFKRLGINEFVNLVTCTDNYNPAKYPEDKSGSDNYIPTWMYASPTFDGLRISLSETSRLRYCDTVPDTWDEFIEYVYLKNRKTDIEVLLTPGLNVVIGGSSSGKSLFVDSIYRKITNCYEGNHYADFENDQMIVKNPSNMKPHYINQNFIVEVLSNKEKNLSDIELLTRVFPQDTNIDHKIRVSLANFKKHIEGLMDATSQIEKLCDELKSIPTPNRLVISFELLDNVLKQIMPEEDEYNRTLLLNEDKERIISELRDLQRVLEANPFAHKMSAEISALIQEVERLEKLSSFSETVYSSIEHNKQLVDQDQSRFNAEGKVKQEGREKLILCAKKYIRQTQIFYEELKSISEFNEKCETQEINVNGHKLSIANEFALTPDIFLNAVNELLKTNCKIDSFDEITPEKLYKSNFKERNPIVRGYKDFVERLYGKISDCNKKKYIITTKENRNFDDLSPGWKSAVILDLILGYDKDIAPIIIDQPEDNLATDYINGDLIDLIKSMKQRKQIILVSHNATIPMLGDAQTVVLCRNIGDQIVIRSSALEGKIADKSIVDYIAEITDGGKSSIKKRVKKYNLKTFRE